MAAALLITASAVAKAEVLAIDILVVPGPSTVSKAIEANKLIVKDGNPASFVFDDHHVPHVTLAQLYVNASKLDDLCREVKAVVRETVPDLAGLRIESDDAQPYSVIKPKEDSLGYALLSLKKTDQLQALHEGVLRTACPYHDVSGGTDAAFAKNPPTIGKSTVDYVTDFCDPAKGHSGPKYEPHITLGMVQPEFESQLSSIRPPESEGAAGIAVYQLGDHGTAQIRLRVVTGEGTPHP